MPIIFGEQRISVSSGSALVMGRFTPKPVPPGTIRSKTIFRTGRFTPGRFAPVVKIEIKVFLRDENCFLVNCEHQCRDEPFPGIFSFCFS